METNIVVLRWNMCNQFLKSVKSIVLKLKEMLTSALRLLDIRSLKV